MPDELPTINEIVQALTTINNRHFKEMQEIRDEYSRANLKDREALERVYRIIDRRDITIEALKNVIEALGETLGKIQNAASHDQRDCVLMEPGDVFRMAKVNIKALRESELRKAKERTCVHSFKAPEPEDGTGLPDDKCTCSHPRQVHGTASDPGGARCTWCSRDKGPSPHHEFALAVLPDDICNCTHPRKHHIGARLDGYIKAWCVSCRDNGTEHHEFALAVL